MRRRPTSANAATESTKLSQKPIVQTVEAGAVDSHFRADFTGVPANVYPKLAVSTPGSSAEREADLVAERITRDPTPQSECACGGECGSCQQRSAEKIQRKASSPLMSLPLDVNAGIRDLAGYGRPMTSDERVAFEPRFGFDFSQVRLHDNATAARLADRIHARAFTVGRDIAFASGELAPGTDKGRRLLAHELTHVVQQGRAGHLALQRAAKGGAAAVDPLCASYAFDDRKKLIQTDVDKLKAAPDVEARLRLIREVKWILRCGSDLEKKDIQTILDTGLGAASAAAVLKEAATPFGGYRGSYPGFYGGTKGRLKALGVTELNPFEAFAYNPRRGKSDPATYEPSAKAKAKAEAPAMTATDLLYFYGHQYAQYGRPGAFANGTQTEFIDLGSLAGDFSRVKLMVSTSCATICKQALDVFTSLFPNAVILGYRKSAPIEGDSVRNAFDRGIIALKKPLLLDQPVDVTAIIDVWKKVVKNSHPREAERLPGYYQAGTVHYLENGAWKSMAGSDASNSCRKKGGRIEEAAH